MTLSKRFMMGTLGVALAFGFLLAGCGGGDDSGDLSTGPLGGTVEFTHMPSSQPSGIVLTASYAAGGYWTLISDGQYSLTINGNAGTWTIPWDDAFLAALDSGEQRVLFEVLVQFNQGEGYAYFAPIEKLIRNRGDLANIDLGTVSLATLTLSGTLDVTLNEQAVPHVRIVVKSTQGDWLGSSWFDSPGPDTPWTIPIPAPASPTDLSFSVEA